MKPKFKAWHKAEKKMCDVSVINLEKGAFLIGVTPGKDEIIDLNGRASIIHAPTEGRFCTWDEFELLQFTGLKDKNGKEIYEGDIVKNKDGHTFEIAFTEGAFLLDGHTNTLGWILDYWKLEVIGNIHEHKELLK